MCTLFPICLKAWKRSFTCCIQVSIIGFPFSAYSECVITMSSIFACMNVMCKLVWLLLRYVSFSVLWYAVKCNTFLRSFIETRRQIQTAEGSTVSNSPTGAPSSTGYIWILLWLGGYICLLSSNQTNTLQPIWLALSEWHVCASSSALTWIYFRLALCHPST